MYVNRYFLHHLIFNRISELIARFIFFIVWKKSLHFYFCCMWFDQKHSITSCTATIIMRNSPFVVFVVAWKSDRACIHESRLNFCLLNFKLLWCIWNNKFSHSHLLFVLKMESSEQNPCTGSSLNVWSV